MKRPLLWYAGAWALGEVLALQCGGLLETGLSRGTRQYMPVPEACFAVMCFAGFLAVGGAAVCFYKRQERQGRRGIWLVLPLFFLLGYLRILQSGDSEAVHELDGRLAEEGSLEAALSGKVRRIEYRNTDGKISYRLLLSGCEVRAEEDRRLNTEEDGKSDTGGMRSYPVGSVQLTFDELPEGVREGKNVLVRAQLSEMEESGNPGQFDSRSYYRGQGISYWAKGTDCPEVSGRTDYLRLGLRLLRQRFAENLFRAAGEKSGGMLCAMVLGEKWEADEGTVSLYTESGMGHLLAISGLHISLAGMGVYRLLRKKLKCSYAAAASGCAFMSFCYYLLTGEGTSAGRAFFMLTVYGVGQVLGRQYDLATAAALAALVMLVRHPFLLFQSGFLLSFGSVLALGILYPLFCGAKLPKFILPFFPGISIQLLTLPVQAYFYYKIPVYSLFLNLVVLPLFTMAALLGIAGALLGGILPGILSIILLPAKGILWIYEFLGAQSLRLPGAVFRTGCPKIWQLLLYFIFLVLLCLWLKSREKETHCLKAPEKWPWGVALFLGMALCLVPLHYRGMELVFLDVGQGDSCFLRTAEGTTFLIDGGSSDEQEIGKYRLEPFLDFQAADQVDFVLISHGDADHINGIRELIGQGRIGTLVLPRGREEGNGLSGLLEEAGRAKIPVLFLGSGERLTAGEAVFTCLWPESPDGRGGNTLDENEASMVLWLSWKELDVLFTGDLEGSGEAAVTSYLKEQQRVSGKTADILKVPHHGSGGTSSAEFLEAVSPKYGIISCGKNNRYGHPADEALERLSDVGCQVFRTDQCGAVTVRSNGERTLFYFATAG